MTILVCFRCRTPLERFDARCSDCGSAQATRAPTPALRRAHARNAEALRRWHWAWRRMLVLEACKREGFHSSAHEAFGDQSAYCLDRNVEDVP